MSFLNFLACGTGSITHSVGRSVLWDCFVRSEWNLVYV